MRLSIGGNVARGRRRPVAPRASRRRQFRSTTARSTSRSRSTPAIQSSAGMLEHYKVRDGDTLTGIASRFGVSMMTVWWANKLDDEGLAQGRPGRSSSRRSTASIVTVKRRRHAGVARPAKQDHDRGDRRRQRARRHEPHRRPGARPPGRQGRADAHAEADAQAPVAPVGGGCGTCGGPVKYQGGPWAWPVVGGGNYISQYFTSGHSGSTSPRTTASTVVSPLSGHVVFAGWKSNGGGYQVWISHGNGIYTSLNHMSAVTASSGQNVGRGASRRPVGMQRLGVRPAPPRRGLDRRRRGRAARTASTPSATTRRQRPTRRSCRSAPAAVLGPTPASRATVLRAAPGDTRHPPGQPVAMDMTMDRAVLVTCEDGVGCSSTA